MLDHHRVFELLVLPKQLRRQRDELGLFVVGRDLVSHYFFEVMPDEDVVEHDLRDLVGLFLVGPRDVVLVRTSLDSRLHPVSEGRERRAETLAAIDDQRRMMQLGYALRVWSRRQSETMVDVTRDLEHGARACA